MQLMIFFMKQVELVNELIKALAEAGIKGCTFLDAHGMAEVLDDYSNIPAFGTLRQMMSTTNRQSTKMMMLALRDDQVTKASETIKSVVGDLSKPNTGVIITVPIYFCEGLVDQNDK